MSWTLTSSGAVIPKSGYGANASVLASGATLAKWSDQAEATISTLTRYDWVTNYASIPANFKGILDDCASDHIAMKVINYDMSGYTSRTEAQTMLDVLFNNFNRIIGVLNDSKNKEVIGV